MDIGRYVLYGNYHIFALWLNPLLTHTFQLGMYFSVCCQELLPEWIMKIMMILFTASGWSPLRNNQDQFLEINLGSVTPVYGLVVAGNPLTRERITAFNVQYSKDDIIWTDIPTDPTDSSSPPKVKLSLLVLH